AGAVAPSTSSEPTVRRRRASSLSPQEREAVWREARDAAQRAAEEIRRLAQVDPAAAADAARSAADVLHVAARVAEPGGKGTLTDAARLYDRASRELHGRRPAPGPGAGELRLAAMSLALLARAAGAREAAAALALMVALSALVGAVADLRATQGRMEQAAAARRAASQLQEAGGPALGAGVAGRSLSTAAVQAINRGPELLRPDGRRR
ncbi:MAG: hypothetical protein ACRDH5_13350, partial [bacterium]